MMTKRKLVSILVIVIALVIVVIWDMVCANSVGGTETVANNTYKYIPVSNSARPVHSYVSKWCLDHPTLEITGILATANYIDTVYSQYGSEDIVIQRVTGYDVTITYKRKS
jgi:hypothetical protein